MCACRQKKSSFLIKDILHEAKDTISPSRAADDAITKREVLQTRFNVITEVQSGLEATKVRANLEQKRNTYPLYPKPIKPNYPWLKSFEHRFPPLYSESGLHSEQILRSQLSLNRFVTPAPFSIRPTYAFDRVQCCNPWWGVGGRRKGGQVRFSAAQTGALERRFTASKYLSPDERRALASSLRLSDRQVKTWFQNRRAKWRRSTSESADAGSPSSIQDADISDDEIHISDP